jgi:hypothetical protein
MVGKLTLDRNDGGGASPRIEHARVIFLIEYREREDEHGVEFLLREP